MKQLFFYFQFPSCSSKVSTLSHCRKVSVKHNRSCSQPTYSPERAIHRKKILHVRKISRSLQNFRENREEDEEEVKTEDDNVNERRLTNLSAREIKRPEAIEIVQEDTNPIYEVSDGFRSKENFYDVFGYMKNIEKQKALRYFAHLQPSNLKPYGSTENLAYPGVTRKLRTVSYPIIGTSEGFQETKSNTKVVDKYNYSEQNVLPEKSSPNLGETKKLTLGENKPNFDVSTKRFSTHFLTARKISSKANKENKIPRLSLSTHFLKKSNSYFTIKTKQSKKKIEVNELYRRVSTHKDPKMNKKSTESFIRSDSFNEIPSLKTKINRPYNTQCAKPKEVCEEYITVKLGDLQAECQKSKKCKPKKMFSGRLPKLDAGRCPCVEPPLMQPAKPLQKLKKRPVSEKPKICPIPLCSDRADATYVLKPKKLKPIKPVDCPCVPLIMKEGTPLKRLVAKPIMEPKAKICEVVCPLKERKKIPVIRKKLPQIPVGNCPCVEPELPEDVPPLKKLNKRPVKEPERVCPKDVCPKRADATYVIKPKKLKPIKPVDCPCVDVIMQDAPPLKRLVPKPVVEPPKICKVVCPLKEARKKIVIERKKLPFLPPGKCPCVEPEPPLDVMPLKKLKKKPVKEPEKVCIVEKCKPEDRADATYVIKPKKLKPIEPKDCPCMPDILDEGTPLKRLVAKPVPEPKQKICKVVCPLKETRKKEIVERKKLPPLPTGNCPCIEPEPPEDVAPLKKLKKRPVKEPDRVCPKDICRPEDRADVNLTIKPKKLPVLEINHCPCVEAKPPEDVDLPRLRKKHIPEPPRICPKDDICEETPRADEDDWMYWKRVQVKCEPEVKNTSKTTKRCFSTSARQSNRFYSTSAQSDNFLRLNFDVFGMEKDLKDQKYNIVIDIKPSAPLILTQKPIDVGNFLDLKRCKSEPGKCMTLVICNNNESQSNELKNIQSKSSVVKDSESGLTFFNTINRFISTCSDLSSQKKHDDLQPQKPFLKEKEKFMEPFPTDEEIRKAARKGRMFYRTREEAMHKNEECADNVAVCDDGPLVCPKEEKKLSLWEKIVNFFKARPGCPTPEEMRQMRLREEAEKAAAKAGLCLYDPKEKDKEMPKVLTAETIKEEMKK